MIVFVKHITPRFQYALNFIFGQLNIEAELTNNYTQFIQDEGPKLNYSEDCIENCFQCIPEGLLNEDFIRHELPKMQDYGGRLVLFKQEEGNIKFDIFSAVFWFISRYEEYLPYVADSHGRFPATESFAFKNKVLNHPIVDEWINYFGCKLRMYYPDIHVIETSFKALTTIDVDSPWSYKNKGLLRNLGGMFRDALKGNSSAIFHRLGVIVGLKTDPWFKFDWLLALQKKNKLDFSYFIHVGNRSTFDKSVSYRCKAFKKIVWQLQKESKVALHPSYRASKNVNVFKEEISRLASITQSEVVESRQHFLVFKTETYYNMLISLGIVHDYSMGFADKPGFRAGTSKPFHYFDINANKETNLIIHPFVVMDRTLNSYENQNPEKAKATLKELIDRVAAVNGTFVSLWHNESLSNCFEWKGWQDVFTDMIDYLESK